MTDYQPISCAQHERLECAILRRIPLQLKFCDAVETETLIRLDQIESFSEA